MTARDQRAAQRAEARERRRRPRDEDRNGDEPQQEEQPTQQEPHRGERPPAQREPLRGTGSEEITEVATQARELLRLVRGLEAESVSSVARTRNGWKVTLEVVELRRIPESTDILASFEVELDGDHCFLGFERGRRYHRAQAESESRR